MKSASRRLFLLEVAMLPFLSRVASAWHQSITKSRKPADAKKSKFSIFEGKLDGHRLVATIDTSLREYKRKADLPWALSVSVPLIKPNDEGLTTRQDANALNKWEGILEKQISEGSNFVYVGRVTWNGYREILYYIANPDPVKRKLQSLLDDHAARPFSFRCEKDETWSKASVYLEYGS